MKRKFISGNSNCVIFERESPELEAAGFEYLDVRYDKRFGNWMASLRQGHSGVSVHYHKIGQGQYDFVVGAESVTDILAAQSRIEGLVQDKLQEVEI